MSALFNAATDLKLNASFHTVVWIVICAQLYSVERAAQKKSGVD